MKQFNAFAGKPKQGKRMCAVFVLCAMTAISLSAQTFTTLFSFGGADGKFPIAALFQGTDGNFYGRRLAAGPTAEAQSSKCPGAAST